MSEFFYFVKENRLKPVIVSKKNKIVIVYRLNQYGLCTPESDIFGRDELLEYSTKAEFISNYMKIRNIDLGYFVDDNSNNLDPCKDYPQITPMLAGWGNIAMGEVGLTPDEIMEVISL